MSAPRLLSLPLAALLLLAVPAMAKAPPQHNGPGAGARTYAQNFKDLVLTTCLATAYKNDPTASVDAGSSVAALRDWTEYDMDAAPKEIQSLIQRYLARDYRNPLAESEVAGIRFDTLKCLDLYHGEELAALTKRLVIHPGRTFRQSAR